MASKSNWRETSISPAQINFIDSLVENLGDKDDIKQFLSETQWRYLENVDNLTKGQASDLIGTLKNVSDVKRQREADAKKAELATKATLPPSAGDGSPAKQGRYFIVDPTDKVEKFVIVTVEVQASDVLYPIKDPVHRNNILSQISKDPINSMNEYGVKLGVCGVCGRTLTNRDSRLKGIGPICAQKFEGVATLDDLDILSDLGLLD